MWNVSAEQAVAGEIGATSGRRGRAELPGRSGAVVSRARTEALNALTVDVEDWYHDESRPAGPARPDEIDRGTPRVARNLAQLLDLLAESQARATFFFLADVARAHPDLVHRALAEGHEIGCHGLRHRPISGRSRDEFRDDVRGARAGIEDTAGTSVRGFRAPCFLRRQRDLWALEVLAECGFEYDSSWLPLRYLPGPAPRLGQGRGPVRLASGLWEFPLPISTLPFGHELPCAAGGFALRALPYAFTRHFLSRFNRQVGPAVVYTHPWEIDPDSPKLPGTPAHVRFFNRVGRRSMAEKLRALAREFRFAPIAEVYAAELAAR